MKKTNKTTRFIFLTAVVILFTAIFLVACGDKSGGEGANPTPSIQKVALTVVGGTISNSSSKTKVVDKNSMVEVTATIEAGKNFVGWNDGREIVSKQNPYSFAIARDTTLTAITTGEDEASLTVVGAEGTGIFKKGDIITLTALEVPTKTRFKKWVDENGELLSESATYTFTIQKSITVKAIIVDLFEIKTIGGKFAVDSENANTSSKNSNTSSENAKTSSENAKTMGYVEDGETIKITADAFESGLRFVGWVDSNKTQVSKDKIFFLKVVKSETFSAIKVKEYTVTVDGISQKFDENTMATITATVPQGFIFDKWLDGDGEVVSSLNPYSFKVTNDISFRATFKEVRSVTIVNKDGLGTIVEVTNYEIEKDKNFTHTASIGEMPNTKMTFLGWERDGVIVSTDNDYTFDVVEQNIKIEAIFSMMYTQTAVDKLGIAGSINNVSSFAEYKKGEYSFIVPGLGKDQNFVVQGIDFSVDKRLAFVCGYISPANGYLTNSVIFVLDMKQEVTGVFNYYGKLIKEIILQNVVTADNATSAYTGLAGGIAVTEKNIFISDNGKLLRLSLEKVLSSKQTAYLSFDQEIKVPVNASYCTFSDEILWVGELSVEGNDSKKIDPAHQVDGFSAWTVGYDINEKGAISFDKATGFRTSTFASENSYATPNYILRHENFTQGMTVAGNKIVLSTSFGTTSNSNIHIFDNKVYGAKKAASDGIKILGGKSVPYWDLKLPTETFSAPPMTNGIAAYLDTSQASSGSKGKYYIFVVTESASTLHNESGNVILRKPMDIAWKLEIAQL